MSVAVIYEHTDEGAVALRAAVAAAEPNEELRILTTWSGSAASGAQQAEHEAVRTEVTNTLPDTATWHLELVDPTEDPTGALIAAVAELAPRLLVLGTRHRSALGKMILGRPQQRLLLEVDHPVLVVKPTRH
ncbi:universal stress protein [Rhodococcoides fascians]|uniref:universal stress protein n=1 Tax=Rhodococcoides fascians TaxID=1828 RepID=UPI000565B527|nr:MULTISPECIES: universal stress protein [Rhodococcus]OZF01279.1 universal stress protein [Rhodococcus sp. 15-1189-1-1a]OZF15450.1 universal stress protein [Rhodococcus sp. 14-2686-1-2]